MLRISSVVKNHPSFGPHLGIKSRHLSCKEVEITSSGDYTLYRPICGLNNCEV